MLLLGVVGGSLAVGATVFLARSYRGENVIIYVPEGSDSEEFRESAERMGRAINATVYPARNAQDILNAIRRHPRIKRLVMVGHGTTRQFMRPAHSGIRVGADALPTWMSVETFAREVGPRMAANGWIGWAGCSSASNPGQSTWSVDSYGPGGELSFVAQVRDAMARVPGIAWGIQLGGHTALGHTTANPGARECPVSASQIGLPCESVLDETWGSGAHQTLHNEWVSAFRGSPAERWISTGTVMV
jgi:hypothetical protein